MTLYLTSSSSIIVNSQGSGESALLTGILVSQELLYSGMDTNIFGLGARTAIHVIFTLWE